MGCGSLVGWTLTRPGWTRPLATRHSPLARSVAVDPYIRTHAHVRPPSGINIGLGSGVLGSDAVIDRTTADCSLPLHSLSVIHLRQSRRTLQSRDNKDEN